MDRLKNAQKELADSEAFDRNFVMETFYKLRRMPLRSQMKMQMGWSDEQFDTWLLRTISGSVERAALQKGYEQIGNSGMPYRRTGLFE